MTVRTGAVEVVEEVPRPEPDGGLGALRTERGNLPLELIEVRSTVAGLAVRTELAQGFRNPFDVPLEATYVFPLPDRAAVTRLRMEAADRVVEGVVKEREAARATYDEAIAEGRLASIAEEERPGVFTLRVGNIMPGEHVVIRTTLAGRLPYEDGQATFRFPLVVAPRYIPGTPLPGAKLDVWQANDQGSYGNIFDDGRCRTGADKEMFMNFILPGYSVSRFYMSPDITDIIDGEMLEDIYDGVSIAAALESYSARVQAAIDAFLN